MNVNFQHGLSEKELQIILYIVSAYKQKINRVGVFGSRANGQYKEYSDIDLVLYGDINQLDIDRLNTLFDESSLGIRVDVKGYETISYLPLKRNIDENVKILFTY